MSNIKIALTGFSRGHKPGDVVTAEKDRAEALIRDGLAEPVTDAGRRLERDVRGS